MDTNETLNENLDTAVTDATELSKSTATPDEEVGPEVKTEEVVQEKVLSKKEEREMKLAYQRMLVQRKETIKRNKELIADKELEVAYWKAEADLMRYRFEKMDFFLKNIEIEPKYLMETEKIRAQQANEALTEKPILD